MPEVCRQKREPSRHINTVTVPLENHTDGKRVAEVVQARPALRRYALKPRLTGQIAVGVVNIAAYKPGPCSRDEKTGANRMRNELIPTVAVRLQSGDRARVQCNLTKFAELGVPYDEDPVSTLQGQSASRRPTRHRRVPSPKARG